MIDLTGKTAIVTGAGRGIGLGCAKKLAEAGAHVIINDRPHSPDLAGVMEQLSADGHTCHGIEANVFDRAGCEQLLKDSLAIAERIDILVSNPAFSRRANFLECTPDLFEQTIQATLTAGFHMSQLTAQHMVETGGGGKIVFISSVQAELPIARCAAYGAAKAGLNHLTRSIAVELAEHKINVNAIEPGWIDTPGEHESFSSATIAAEGAQLRWRRMGLPEDIGAAATFLCSDAADYITGSILPVDGLFRYKDWKAESTIE
jgi:glucose 1-dehydrogenase